MTIAELRGVTVSYGQGPAVLAGLDLRVARGTTLVVGPNGSGKSTLVELLAGTLAPTTGTVTVLGAAAHDRRLVDRRRVCRATPALYPGLTVAEHVDLVAGLRGIPVADARERLERYGLGPWWRTPTAELSTGNLRKAWLVLSTLGDVELLVLDEPFNGLDREGTAVLLDELAARRTGWILVAHRPPEPVAALTDHVVELGGRGRAGSEVALR
jgi:ABC-type multidrug transport system ATPase subunit